MVIKSQLIEKYEFRSLKRGKTISRAPNIPNDRIKMKTHYRLFLLR